MTTATAKRRPSALSQLKERNLLGVMLVMVAGLVGIGIVDGTGGVVWPEVKEAYGISTSQLGFGLSLGMAAAFPVMLFGGSLADRIEKRYLLIAGMVCLTLSAFAMPFGAGAMVLSILLIIRGFGVSTIDLTANAITMDMERDTGLHLMSPLHAGYSAGLLIGGLAASVVFSLGGNFKIVWGFAGFAFLVMLLATIRVGRTAPGTAISAEERTHSTLSLGVLKSRVNLLLAILTGLSFTAEMLVAQFSALYLRDQRGFSSTVGALAVGALGLSMFVARMLNGPITARLTPRFALIAQTTISTGAGVVLIMASTPWLALVGALLAGIGLGGIIPTALNVVGTANPTQTGAASGAILLAGYSCVAIAPTIAGRVATDISLRGVMVMVAAVCAVMVVAAMSLPKYAGVVGEPVSAEQMPAFD